MVIINIGARGEGKSSLTKRYMRLFKKKLPGNVAAVYDVQNEYKSKDTPELTDEEQKDVEIWLNKVFAFRQSFIVIEEATAHFSYRSSGKILKSMCINARHSQNWIILNFHSFRSVPNDLLELCDAVNAFNTEDNLDPAKKKFKNYENMNKLLDESRKCDVLEYVGFKKIPRNSKGERYEFYKHKIPINEAKFLKNNV